MKINISALHDGDSVDLVHEYSPEHENINYDDAVFKGHIQMQVTVRREAQGIFVEGVIAGHIERTCALCLTTVEEPFSKPVHLNLCITDTEEIDITDDIREIIIFDHPMRFVCSPSCKGLCPSCGKNLNMGTCTCRDKNSGVVWNALKERLKNK